MNDRPTPAFNLNQPSTDEVTVTLTVNELRCLLGAAARDVAHQETRMGRCRKGSETWYTADYLRSSSEVAGDAIRRLLGWA